MAEPIDVPLRLLDDEPTTVCGDRAFVLFVDGVGRVEVGSPLPDHSIWNHFSGDLMYSTMQPIGGDGLAGGGGEEWNDPKVSAMWSEPGSGDDPDEAAWVVVGRIPAEFGTVLVRQGDWTAQQDPIRGHAVLPLDSRGTPGFVVFGLGQPDTEVALFSTEGLY